MTHGSYKQFCPVAMAAELLCTRWTIVLIRELLAGSTRFNDLRRGVPRMSPALLSQRLRDLESAGVIRRAPVSGEPDVSEYRLTPAGEALRPVIEGFGFWGQRWIDSTLSLEHLDAQLLMWDMRRNLDPQPLPRRRSVIEFLYPEQPPAERKWWLIAAPGMEAGCAVDVCLVDPGFDVDLYVSTDLRTMTAIWMGHDTVEKAIAADRLALTGDRALAGQMQTWLGLSPFAKGERFAS
ncbi:MAG: transcriptional regulator [Alphaproteobacteria bacterium]|nr:transcriptional regulator [Alphaproteobacteria bacterium]